MTTEKQQVAATEDFEIVDTTPPEVEAEIAAARGEPAPQTPPPAEAATPSPKITEAPAVAEQTPPGTPRAEPPPKRTYSEDEWGKMRQSVQARENELRKRLEALEAQQGQAALEANIEAVRRQTVEAYQAQGIDPLQAEQLASQVAAEKRQALIAKAEADQIRQLHQRTQQDAEQAAALSLARIFATENDLSQEQLPILLTARDPYGMEMLAKELGTVSKLRKEAGAAKKASVPPVKVEGGSQAASPANRDDEVSNRIVSGDATEEDWTYYRTKMRFR